LKEQQLMAYTRNEYKGSELIKQKRGGLLLSNMTCV